MLHLSKIIAAGSVVLIAACSPAGSSTDPAASLNAAPVVANANPDQTATVGYDFIYDATQANAAFSDPDGDPLTYSISIAPDSAGLSAANGVISGAPASAGPRTVTVTANDGAGHTVSDAFTLEVGIDQDSVLAAFDGKIDLAHLDNYADADVPDYITQYNDNGNPVSDAGATLGRVLFYDENLSSENNMSCAFCHKQQFAFGDNTRYTFGQFSEMPRHTSRLINTMYGEETHFFWNERVASVEAQVVEPIKTANEQGFSGELGFPSMDDLIARLNGIEYYRELFRFVYLDPEVTEERMATALSQFVRSIHSFDSRWDVGRAQVASADAPFPNFTADENAGKTLFTHTPAQGGSGCFQCHRPPEFDIDPNAGSNGDVTVLNDDTTFDYGNTRAPSIRDLVDSEGALTGPYMHDGGLKTLRAVIDHYDNIEIPKNADPAEFLAALDSRLQNGGAPQQLGLTEDEKNQLEAFLRTLGGTSVYTDEKWSSPFPAAAD